MRSFLTLALTAVAALTGCFSPSLSNPGYYCHAEDNPACPDGFSCLGGRCVSSSASSVLGDGGLFSIPKTGTPYAGVHQPRTDLDTASMCPDADTEPNDSIDHPYVDPAMPMTDVRVSQIIGMAICPKGPNPATGLHDIDYIQFDTSSAATDSLTVMAELTYDISYGDLDVAVVDSTGKMIQYDGSAVSNACVTASIGKGVYYVVVAGANNMDINSYKARINTFSTPHSCPTATPVDMATAPACGTTGATCGLDADCCSNSCFLGTCD